MISILNHDFESINQYIDQQNFSKIFILCDENTHEFCLPQLLGNLEITIPFEIIEIESGEDNKTINTAAQLWEILAEMEADRQSLLINLGGGVITDMGGFIASTYKRGIKFINLPTSLLGMCDASIGGKTGIDHNFLKNIIGTFTEPDCIFVYPDYLKTLDPIQLRSGFAEMLKHGLIADATHWEQLIAIEELSPSTIIPLIERSMAIKEEVVKQDFKEQNIRKNLNFGHTIGHAIESLFLQQDNIIPHGEAVAIGMICETYLSSINNLFNKDDAQIVIKNIQKHFPYIEIDNFDNSAILSLMQNDKKNKNGMINFSLIDEIGHCLYDQKANAEQIIAALDYYKALKDLK